MFMTHEPLPLWSVSIRRVYVGLLCSPNDRKADLPSQSQKYHLENPYLKTFGPYVEPLLDRPMDLRRHEELDTSKDVQVPV
jgi:hypothetical protein